MDQVQITKKRRPKRFRSLTLRPLDLNVPFKALWTIAEKYRGAEREEATAKAGAHCWCGADLRSSRGCRGSLREVHRNEASPSLAGLCRGFRASRRHRLRGNALDRCRGYRPR